MKIKSSRMPRFVFIYKEMFRLVPLLSQKILTMIKFCMCKLSLTFDKRYGR